MVHPSEINDPAVISCDPQGMPRQNLYELRTTQILQTPYSVVILYEFDKIWRVIWADGRELEKEHPEPRWFGYSVGKWEDDYTFVVQTNGTDERTWLDKAGRPHSEDLLMTERFHRVSQDRLEWTVIIDDPKMYTKTWVALDKFPYLDFPELKFNEHESTEMPFRYVQGEDGKPIMPKVNNPPPQKRKKNRIS